MAIEIRAGDKAVRKAISFLDDNPASNAETDCERALLKKLGGGCQVPIGASARLPRWQLASRSRGREPGRQRLAARVRHRDAIRLNWEKKSAKISCAVAAIRYWIGSIVGKHPCRNSRSQNVGAAVEERRFSAA